LWMPTFFSPSLRSSDCGEGGGGGGGKSDIERCADYGERRSEAGVLGWELTLGPAALPLNTHTGSPEASWVTAEPPWGLAPPPPPANKKNRWRSLPQHAGAHPTCSDLLSCSRPRLVAP
jgi:hypothetical protein